MCNRSKTFEFFFTTAIIGSEVLKFTPPIELAAFVAKSPLSRLDVREWAIPVLFIFPTVISDIYKEKILKKKLEVNLCC